jgi:hypothetical protein
VKAEDRYGGADRNYPSGAAKESRERKERKMSKLRTSERRRARTADRCGSERAIVVRARDS